MTTVSRCLSWPLEQLAVLTLALAGAFAAIAAGSTFWLVGWALWAIVTGGAWSATIFAAVIVAAGIGFATVFYWAHIGTTHLLDAAQGIGGRA